MRNGYPATGALPFPLPPRSLALAGQPAMLSWVRAFPGTPWHAGTARRFAANLLMGSPLREDAVLVISELFTNAVAHTASGKPEGVVTVQVSRWRHGARIAVADQGSAGEPVICEPVPGSPAGKGNGLFMVSCLAARMHWHGGGSGRIICAVLARPADSAPAAWQGPCRYALAANPPCALCG